MSTVHAWLKDADVDWTGFRTAGRPPVLRRRERGQRPGRTPRPLFSALLLAAVGVAGAALLAPGQPATKEAAAEPTATPGSAGEAQRQALLTHIAACESDGDPSAVSSDGRYHGKYQFDLATWRSVGGIGHPSAAPEPEQDRRANLLLMARGTAPWPRCGPAARAP